jgi:hypothetical protein
MATLPTKTGWRPILAIDLLTAGNAPGTCERCGRCDLRFLHTVAHADGRELRVGCECARRLYHGYSPEREEGRLRNLWARRCRWLTRNWGTSWKGNETLTFCHKGETVRVTVFADESGAWAYCISVDDQRMFSPTKFASPDAAKLAAFDMFAAAAEW